MNSGDNMEVKVNQKELEKSFKEACENMQFRRLLKTIEVEDEIAMKYTSSLEETVEETAEVTEEVVVEETEEEVTE